MVDGNQLPENAVAQVAALKPGESYGRSKFIPAYNVSPDGIRETKRRLLSAMTPVIARAKKRLDAEYRLHGFHVYTRDCDVIVSAVVSKEVPVSAHGIAAPSPNASVSRLAWL